MNKKRSKTMTNQFEMNIESKQGNISYKITGEESYIKAMTQEIFERHDIKSEKYRVDDRYADSLKRFYDKDKEKNKPKFDPTPWIEKHKKETGVNLAETQSNTWQIQTNSQYNGIKYDNRGNKRYQLRYICPKCENRGKHYIYEESDHVSCHECKKHMAVESIKKNFGHERDTFKNFYYAGLYLPVSFDDEVESK